MLYILFVVYEYIFDSYPACQVASAELTTKTVPKPRTCHLAEL